MAWHQVGYPPQDVGNTVLLLGNGLNRTAEGPSWEVLIEELYDHIRPDPTIRLDLEKPFPLLYEELFLYGRQNLGIQEDELLKLVANHASKIRTGEIHEEIANIDVRHYLTTNYDLATAQAVLGNRDVQKPSGPVKETRYSLLRRTESDRRVLWHIHGVQTVPSSIMLGYEHYGGYLGRIRSYITSGVRYQDQSLKSLVSRLSDEVDLIRSWVDFFFTKDVVILGLSLDFVEINLWWLLTYRARLIANEATKVQGSVTYFCSRDGKREQDTRRRQRLELLHATGVRVIQLPLRGGNWKSFYRNAFSEIRGLVR